MWLPKQPTRNHFVRPIWPRAHTELFICFFISQMHKCMAQDAQRNAPCLYKVWTYVFWCKVRGPIYLRNSFFCGTHTQMGQRAFCWLHGSLKLVRAVHQPVDCQLRIREPPFPPPLASKRARRASGKKKKENKPSSFTSRIQTPFYPSFNCSLTLWKTSFISVQELLPRRELCTSKPLRLPLSISILQPVCLSTLLFGWHPKEKKLMK